MSAGKKTTPRLPLRAAPGRRFGVGNLVAIRQAVGHPCELPSALRDVSYFPEEAGRHTGGLCTDVVGPPSTVVRTFHRYRWCHRPLTLLCLAALPASPRSVNTVP